MYSRHWGALACHLVRFEGRYSVWITSAEPGEQGEAYGMLSEAAGRAFVDAWQASNLLHTPWDERIATISLLSPDTQNGILYEAAVVNVEDSGIWLACFDDTANEGARARSATSATSVKRSNSSPPSPSGPPASSAAASSAVASSAVGGPSARRTFSPVSCVTGRQRSAPTRPGPRWAMPSAAISVTELYAIMKNGERVDWPIYDDPRNSERYFAVIADCEALADIVAAAPTGSTSLKPFFGMWFSQPPDHNRRRARGD